MNYGKVFVTGGSGFIGTNLIDALAKMEGTIVLNVDIKKPKIAEHCQYWREIDIRDKEKMEAVLNGFVPDLVIHLAARTDLDGECIEDYSTNTDGTKVLVTALEAINFSGSVIFTSSMYVCQPGYQPVSEDDYCPHTVYGKSKVLTEQIVKESRLSAPWAIIRPTSIWGPWFGVPYIDFFRVVLNKRFLHIAGHDTYKTYGYVGNSVAQILALAKCVRVFNGRSLYIGDSPAYSIREWADEIAAHVPYKILNVPRAVFVILAKIGDVLGRVGIRFPMTSFRLSNLTTNNVHDIKPIESILPVPPYSRVEANRITLAWLKSQS